MRFLLMLVLLFGTASMVGCGGTPTETEYPDTSDPNMTSMPGDE